MLSSFLHFCEEYRHAGPVLYQLLIFVEQFGDDIFLAKIYHVCLDALEFKMEILASVAPGVGPRISVANRRMWVLVWRTLKKTRPIAQHLQLQRKFFDHIANLDVFLTILRSLGGVCFFMKDKEGRFMGGNPAQLAKLGVASETELVGKSDTDFFPTNLILQYRKDDIQVMKTGKAVLNRVEPVSNPDGSISWHITSKYPLRNAKGESIGIMGIMKDFDRAVLPWNLQRPFLKVMDYIDTHYSEEILVKDLAVAAGLSMSQFERRFTSIFGQTPSRFLVRYRLTKASHLLANSDMTLGSVALECGFCDHSHFSRSFTATFGVAPGEYRRNLR